MPRLCWLALTAIVLILASTQMLCALPALDLGLARLIADRGDWGSSVPVPQLADGKQETSWTSGPADLRESPANLFIVFPDPVVLGALELDTVNSKNAWRVTDFEVYGRVGQDWALLGKSSGLKQATLRVEFPAARVQTLRVRLRDNEREGHGWAIVTELRAFAAAVEAQPATLAPGDVPGETRGEKTFVTWALGEQPKFPNTAYDPARGYGFYVRSFLDTMLKLGTDVYGPEKSPLFVSILMLDTKAHPESQMPSMPGQRMGDRAMFGGNLQHDVPLLLAMPHAARLLKEPRFGEASAAYLGFFMATCTKTPTGLWPWGEHAHWDFFKETWGHTTHEYLGAPPLELLETAWQLNPKAVVGEADGMLEHIHDFNTYQFNRHADIVTPQTDESRAAFRGLDFPRHGAMFARHWAFTYSKTRDAKYLGYVDGMLKHFALVRQKDGTIPVLSELSDRSALGLAYGCNLSVGVSLLEAAPLLGETETGKQARQLGTDLLAVVAQAPIKKPKAALFDMAYGGGSFNGIDPLLRVAACRLTDDKRHLEGAKAFAEMYAAVDKMPREGNIRGEAYGLLVNLYLDLAELDGDSKWLAAAERYARFGIEDLYVDGLFRGASNLAYYDSELYVSTFVYGLVRLQARLGGEAATVPPLYFHR